MMQFLPSKIYLKDRDCIFEGLLISNEFRISTILLVAPNSSKPFFWL